MLTGSVIFMYSFVYLLFGFVCLKTVTLYKALASLKLLNNYILTMTTFQK